MPLEEEMTLFAVLQDIADELRRIKRERQEGNQECTTQSTAYSLTLNIVYSDETFYGDQENQS